MEAIDLKERCGSFHFDLFPEMATSLLFFINRLHHVLKEAQTEHVFFLSREGQPLMHMFETFQNKRGRIAASHYLEVSRRSTLLPSLGPLAEESFHTLFRQYRRMSLYEFLSSLSIENYCSQFANELGLDNGTIHEKVDDFGSSQLFTRLKALPSFIAVYDMERNSRRNAFLEYFFALSGEKSPSQLVIVDVGWKGTIQDNLFDMLCRNGMSPVNSITGYYIGLVDSGSASPKNKKHGLLFSCIGKRTPYFHVFNENRALFEVLLAADHGSTASYVKDSDGARPVRDCFEEGEMLAEKVIPVQLLIMEHFKQLTQSGHPSLDLGHVGRLHSRMVFNPSQQEVHWFISIFHIENYGVFERSYFQTEAGSPSLRSRLDFIINVIRKRRPGELGFWPWLTLRIKGGRITSFVYAAIRFLQR